MITYNIEIEEGEGKTIGFTYRAYDTGLPKDLTGYSALLEIKNKVGDSVVALSKTSAGGSIQLGGITGQVDVIFTAADSAAAIAGDFVNGVYDLLLTPQVGEPEKIAKGFFTLVRG